MQSEPSNKGLNSLHRQNKSDEEEDESDDESEPRNIFRADSRARIKPANSYDRDSKEHSTETRPEQPTNEFESTVRSGNDRKSLMKDQMVVKSYSDDEEDLDLDESDDS
uniref:Uncharacterized protein n=1 Tax=Euplotes harpa TaxID=151035 RepID=A0A7S3J868_9SPIT|mmetsp:Transcript_25088/g.28850  ORF Transcript_25088/g.28850 Transcript_25088/m.28850 type:complete len:109 (+) Transcript_25088:1492-1818(+)